MFISDRWNNEHFHFILCPFLCSNFQLKTCASFITGKTSASKEDDAGMLSHVRLFVTPWTVAHQAPLSKGISLVRILKWIVISSSRESSQLRNRTCTSCIGRWSLPSSHLGSPYSVVSHSLGPHGLQPMKLLHPWNFPGKSTGVGFYCLLQYRYRGELLVKPPFIPGRSPGLSFYH